MCKQPNVHVTIVATQSKSDSTVSPLKMIRSRFTSPPSGECFRIQGICWGSRGGHNHRGRIFQLPYSWLLRVQSSESQRQA